MTEPPEVRRGRRTTKQWKPVSHGLYRTIAHLEAPCDDLHAWRLVLPTSGAFTHLTAAREWGWWLPPLPDDLPVLASQSTAQPRPRRTGLRVTRHPRPVEVRHRAGLPLTSPAETLLACARDLGTLDLVVLTDSALHLRSCTLHEVAAVAAARRAGAPRLRRALTLADGRSESPWESVLRMLHVSCDVPVVPQHEVYDEDGSFVARGDLWLRGTRMLHEYDGGTHLERSRQRADLRRGRRLANAGWARRGYTSIDVLRQAVGILRDADLSLGRPHRPEQVRAWHALLADSLFTVAGTTRLRRRWGLAS